jgi:hypothetical protein
VISEGDERVRSTTFDLKVSAVEVVVDDQSSDGGSSSGDGLSENTSNLAWFGLYELLFIILFATYASKR